MHLPHTYFSVLFGMKAQVRRPKENAMEELLARLRESETKIQNLLVRL
jgi:hypothetical protein